MSDSMTVPYWVQRATEAEKEIEKLRLRIIQDNKDYGCELMDPCGTIWDHAKKVQDERDALRAALSAMVDLWEYPSVRRAKELLGRE